MQGWRGGPAWGMFHRMKRALLSLLLAAAGGSASAEPGPEGRWRLTGEPDVGSELLISSDGTFGYGLSAGALDEYSRGRWRREGDRLLLFTDPKPIPPAFSAGPARAAGGAATIRVVGPEGSGVAGIDVLVGFADGSTAEGYTQEEGWSLPAGERRKPIWVELSVPMFGLASKRLSLSETADDFTFVLTPNDLGLVDFEAARVDVERGRLILHHGEAAMTYERVRD